MKFSDFLTYFTDTIFRRDVTEWRNPVVRWLVQQYRLLFYTARGLLETPTLSTTSSTSPKTPWHVRRAAWWPPWRWSCFSGP